MAKKDTIELFSNIKGIGKTKAELLYENGFDSLEKIDESSIKKLTGIKGINEKLAIDIKNQVKNQIKSIDIKKTKKEIKNHKEKDETKYLEKKEKISKEKIIE